MPGTKELTHWSLGEMGMISDGQFSTDDKSTLVKVMALCCQVTSHYLNQCWHRSMSPYGVTRPQWVKAPLRCSIWSSQPPAAGMTYVEAPAMACHRVIHCLTYVHLDGTWTCAGGLHVYYMVCMKIYAWNLLTFPWPFNDLFTVKPLI